MATETQIKANRKNALKSTGPRTEEGKDASSQNAIKHGLRTKRDVIKTENQDEFDIYRTKMLDDLSPDGAMEEMLCERIVSLSWRLKRAEHFQNAVIDAFIDRGLHGSRHTFNWCSDCKEKAKNEAEAGDMEILLGIAINHDFANAKTLDMLLSYERRIESSLYRTIAELKKARRMRKEQDENVAWDSVRLPSISSGREPVERNSPKSSPCVHGQACPEQGRKDAHAQNVWTNEPNFVDESSENHPHPEETDEDTTHFCTNEANFSTEKRN